MPKVNEDHATRERLLKEAEVLFSQRGYRDAGVREITAAARCNQAAINYHFGSKRNLYIEVFRSRWIPRAKRIHEFMIEALAPGESHTPEEIIRALAKAFLEGPMPEVERLHHHQLMARELAQPTEAFDLVADQVTRPFFREMADRFRWSMDEEVDDERLMLGIMSIFVMVVHFNFARTMITRITGREYDEAFKARLVEHITEFALKGMGIGEKKGER